MSARAEPQPADLQPLALLERWLDEAHQARLPDAESVTFVTVGEGARPSARIVLLKRLEPDALVFTSALWTRKARELERNPHVALLFYWPSLGRQVHVAGDAVLAERAPAHQLQTIVSRQGEPIDDLAPLRARYEHLRASMEAPPACPSDWGAFRVRPQAIEFWSEAPDRMHDRLLYQRDGEAWSLTRLSP